MIEPQRYATHPRTSDLAAALRAITGVLQGVDAADQLPRIDGIDIASRFDTDRGDYVIVCSVQMQAHLDQGAARVADLMAWHDALIGQSPPRSPSFTAARHTGPRDDHYMRLVLHTLIASADVQMFSYVDTAVADALDVPVDDTGRYSWQPGHPVTPGTVRRYLAATVTA